MNQVLLFIKDDSLIPQTKMSKIIAGSSVQAICLIDLGLQTGYCYQLDDIDFVALSLTASF